MKTIITEKAFHNGGDYEKSYVFAPSVSKRKTVGGKSYYVRRYFKGGKDFEKTMKQLAAKQNYKNAG